MKRNEKIKKVENEKRSLNLLDQYQSEGFVLFKGLFDTEKINCLAEVMTRHHHRWVADNMKIYHEGAINSAYITAPKYLADSDREIIFQFIAAPKISDVACELLPNGPAFMNTQLFFNPFNSQQLNYWHRDPQYHLSIEGQQQALSGAEVLHFRVALKDEPGIELVPGSHRNWDTEEQLDVRFEKNGRRKSDELIAGKKLPLDSGDLLVFSGNMLHRGLYGMDRFAFDILLCDKDPALLQYVDAQCLPSPSMMAHLDAPIMFENTQLMLA